MQPGQVSSEKGALDKIGEILGHFDRGMRNLKKSVITFEDFETRFKELSGAQASTEVSLEMVKQKMFVDEFFDPTHKEILPKETKSYDIKNHPFNEKLLQGVFLRGESVLPI